MSWPTTSRHERGYGSDWDLARQQVMTRDKGLCQPCLAKDRVTPATEVDHVTSKAKGGTDDMENLQAICGPCHKAKTALDRGVDYRPKRRIAVDGWPVQD